MRNFVFKFLVLVTLLTSLASYAQKRTVTVRYSAEESVTYAVRSVLGSGSFASVVEIGLPGEPTQYGLKIFHNRAFGSHGYQQILTHFPGGLEGTNLAEFKIVQIDNSSFPAIQMPIFQLNNPHVNNLTVPNLFGIFTDAEPQKNYLIRRDFLEAKIADIYKKWRASFNGLKNLELRGLAHNDYKPNNVFWNEAKQDYFVGDFDFVTPLVADYSGGAIHFFPPDSKGAPDSGMDRDLFALAQSFGTELFGDLFTLLYQGKPHFSRTRREFEILRQHFGNIGYRTLRHWPQGLPPESRIIFESMMKFSDAYFRYTRSEREAALVKLSEDPTLDAGMRSELQEFVVRHQLKIAPWWLPAELGNRLKGFAARCSLAFGT